MVKDKRIGEQVEKPYPKCSCCKIHMKKAINILGDTYFWKCPECSARYEIIEEQEESK